MNAENNNLNEGLNKTLPVPTMPQPIVSNQASNSLNPLISNLIPQSSPQPSENLTDIKIVDNDLIEKVWVEKIKTIIKQTRGNPFKQSEEINKLKADYMLKEHNRVIKIK